MSGRAKTILNILAFLMVVGFMGWAIYEEGHNPLLYTVTIYKDGQPIETYKHQTIKNMCDCSKDGIYLFPAKIYIGGTAGSSYKLQLEERDNYGH